MKKSHPAHSNVPCALCGCSVIGASFVLCSSCVVPVHSDCWDFGNQCPVYGCANVECVDPAVILFRQVASPSAILPAVPDPSPNQVDAAEMDRRLVRLRAQWLEVIFGFLAGTLAILGLTVGMILSSATVTCGWEGFVVWLSKAYLLSFGTALLGWSIIDGRAIRQQMAILAAMRNEALPASSSPRIAPRSAGEAIPGKGLQALISQA
jgi:hypothetical protein